MRAVLQKVTSASVSVDELVIGAIQNGYVIFLGVLKGDTEAQADAFVRKIVALRLFDGIDGKINDRSILDVSGSILVVSQFTLAGRTEKGNRPDYTNAEAPERAKALYEYCIKQFLAAGIQNVEQGKFGAHMHVSLVNDGPVTLLLES